MIYVSITPFGQDGPKASYADSDLVILAAGGPLLLYGDEDRPPVRVSVPQAYLHACGDAAAGALVANLERQRSGSGQHVDVSAQQSVTLATQANNLAYRLGADEARRMAGALKWEPSGTSGVACERRLRNARFPIRPSARGIQPKTHQLSP